MLYTFGYARLTPQSLAVLAERLDAIVTDCRAKPCLEETRIQPSCAHASAWLSLRMVGQPPRWLASWR